MKMIRCIVLLFVACALYPTLGAPSQGNHFAKLVSASEKTQVIPITPSLFKNLYPDTEKNTQNFSLAILFTHRDAQQCPYCPLISESFSQTAQTYYKTLGSQGYASETFQKNPIFFASCDYQDCNILMQLLHIDTLPRVGIVPSSGKAKPIKGQPQLPFGVQFMDLAKENDVAAFISKKTGHTMETPLSMLEIATGVLSIGFLVGFIVVLVLPKLVKIYKNPMLWFAISLAVYAFVMSGGVYNSIHNPGWYYKAPNGAITFIYPSPRQQFIAEGLLMSATLTGLGIITVSLTQYIPQAKDPWHQRILFAMIATCWIVCYRFLFAIFRVKNRFYPY